MVHLTIAVVRAQRARWWQRAGMAVFSVAAATVIGGCAGGIHLHNPADAELARKAGDAFKAADVAGVIASQRKALAAAHERDLLATRRNLAAERDAAIVAGLEEGQTASALAAQIKGRLSAIGLPDNDDERRKLKRLGARRRAALASRDQYLVAVADKSVPPPAFPPSAADARAAAETRSGDVRALFKQYQDKSQRYFDDVAALRTVTAGAIGDINKKIDETDRFIADVQKETAAKKQALSEAVKAYEAAAASPAGDLTALRTQVDNALRQFDTLSDSLATQGKAAGLDGVEDLIAGVRLERLTVVRDQIGKFLGLFSPQADAAAGSGAQRSAADASGRTAAVLAKAATEVQEAAAHERLVPLIFEQERLRQESVRAQRALERARQRLTLHERQQESLMAEAMRLLDAQNTLTHVERMKPSPTVSQLLNDPATRRAIVHVLFRWAESIAVDKLRSEEADVALISLDHDQALDASELALGLWTHMIGAPLNELAAYHASGLKPEDIANLIHAIGLGGIAVGVNR